MVDNPFLLPIPVSAQIPTYLFLVPAVAVVGAVCGIWLSALPALLQFISTLMLAVYCLLSGYLWYRHTPHKLILMPDDSWRIINRNSRVYLARLRGNQYLHPCLLVLQLYWDHHRRFVLLVPAANNAQDIRRLTVRIAHPLTRTTV